MLSSAEELSKLKEIDPNVIAWILKRSEKEQETRLNFNNERIKLAHRETNITIISFWLAFILAVSVLALGALFICLGKEVAGTIFGGVGILVVVQSFLKFGRKEK